MKGMEKIYADLGAHRDYIVALILGAEYGEDGTIPTKYARAIANKVADEVARDIHTNADHEEWVGADVRLAFWRVLCKRLKIKI